MVAAISVVFMLLTRFLPYLDITFTAIAGILLAVIVIEAGEKWAFLVYITVGLLSLLLSTYGAAFYYILFFGPYPILKSFFERISSKILQWAIKIICFNICAAILYFVLAAVTGLPEAIAKYGLIISGIVVNICFIIYDIALSKLIYFYANSIRAKIKP